MSQVFKKCRLKTKKQNKKGKVKLWHYQSHRQSLFAVAYLAYTIYASRQARGRINHDAHLSGALAGVAFVVLTDPAALGRAWGQLLA